LFHAPGVEVTAADQDRTNALLRQSCEGRFEIAIGSGIHNNELQTQRACRCLQVCDDGLGSRKRRVRENAEHASIGYCCARAIIGHAAALASPATNSLRRIIQSPRRHAAELIAAQ
jgi:hypothetical protein